MRASVHIHSYTIHVNQDSLLLVTLYNAVSQSLQLDTAVVQRSNLHSTPFLRLIAIAPSPTVTPASNFQPKNSILPQS